MRSRESAVTSTSPTSTTSSASAWCGSGEGRSKATLEAFFDYLGPEKTAVLEGICCDMWQPYIDVVKDRAPQAVLVFDKFHIVRHLMQAVDQVRRDEVREKGPAHKALM